MKSKEIKDRISLIKRNLQEESPASYSPEQVREVRADGHKRLAELKALLREAKKREGLCSLKFYKGETIERIFPSGYYSAFVQGKGTLKADTIEGIKQLIREAKATA